MNAKQLKAIQERWQSEVFDKPDDIDSEGRYVWEGVLLGFLLGAGVPLEQAENIAIQAPRNGWQV